MPYQTATPAGIHSLSEQNITVIDIRSREDWEREHIQGGLNAWKKAGYPTQVNRSKPLPLMRQVQIVAGSLALAGTLGGTFFSPYLYVLLGFVGAGLLFAGISGWCGMAKLLEGMPWNQTR